MGIMSGRRQRASVETRVLVGSTELPEKQPHSDDLAPAAPSAPAPEPKAEAMPVEEEKPQPKVNAVQKPKKGV
jgi:hypothetical protein